MKKEELLDKYIKYNSKITFDIFKLIYQKLIDLGFTSPHNVEDAFKEFSGKYPYFVMSLYSGELFFNQYADNFIKCPEISVKDLLGYNPFESFILPEKWCIKVQEMKNTPEEIVNWRLKIVMCGTWVSPGYLNNHGYHSTKINQEYTELTLEQFKQYVLKEPLISKPIKPFPTHWCIELNKETIPIVGVYYNKKHLSDPKCDTYTGYGAIGCYVKSHNGKNEYIKNGYTSCTFYGEPSDSYPEITLEQFKEFVMNEPVKIETMETEKDWSNATEEELLEEAKRRYPVGCIFKCLVTGYDYVIKEDVEFKYEVKGIYSYIDNSLYHKHYENNQWSEVVSLPESKVEESVPEYVECFYSDTYAFIINKIYKCEKLSSPNNLSLNSETGLKEALPYEGGIWKFKPSTKEAFEAQNKPVSIEKWSVGSYGVVINNTNKKFPIGFIDEIIPTTWHKKVEFKNYSSYDPKNLEYSSGLEFKWFATKPEAEEFAKTLVKLKDPYIINTIYKIEEIGKFCLCKYEGMRDPDRMKGYILSDMNGNLEFEKGSVYITTRKVSLASKDECNWLELCIKNNKFISKPPLQQAVHCKTQEEWDFVTKKLKYEWSEGYWSKYGEDSCIEIGDKGYGTSGVAFKNYQILSFQEWCDLNGYKMKKTRFKTGDYVVSLRPENLSTYSIKSNYCYIQYKDGDKISVDNGATMYETDFHYARLATPEEIEEYKRIGQPYDVTTLQSPTINTYGLNVGDTLNQDIICKWSGNAKNRYSSEETAQWAQSTSYFCGDRVIKSFKVIDNVVGFLVSGTLGIYLRAEGFKEFADNYYTETTSNFKVGSWYKYNGYYLKYSKTNDKNIFIASEYINIENNEFKDNLIDFTCGDADSSKELVTDLSVIQQYLPEGHPNKFIRLNETPMGIKIETNSFYGSTLVQRSQFNKEEIYLLPDPD